MEVKPYRPRVRHHPQTAVSVTVRLTLEQFESACRLAGNQGIQYQTLLKRLIGDGLRDLERAARLRDWK
jgi:predicted DNA binding CopG/RHH family protein